MSEFCRTTAQSTPADLHHHLRPLQIPGSPLVACRICDAVFSSSQALINHIGAHVADDGAAASRRQSSQHHRSQHGHRFPHGPPPRASSSSAMYMASRFSAANSLGYEAGESGWANQLSPFARSLYREGMPPYGPPSSAGQYLGNWSAAAAAEEGAAGDCTKPYINQLERFIPKVADRGEENECRQLYFSKLDLTLKL